MRKAFWATWIIISCYTANLLAAEKVFMGENLKGNGYSIAVKNEFADLTNADCWVIAYAKAYDNILVTDEILNENKKKIPIPKVCVQFDVHYVNTFQMLRKLGIVLN